MKDGSDKKKAKMKAKAKAHKEQIRKDKRYKEKREKEKAVRAEMLLNQAKKEAYEWIQPFILILKAYRDELEAIQWNTTDYSADCLSDFISLLAALPSLRGVQGIPQGMGQLKLSEDLCKNDKNLLIVFLKTFGVTDESSFLKVLGRLYRTHQDYVQFIDTKEGRYWTFDPKSLSDNDRSKFEVRMGSIGQLVEICDNLGFIGWDVGERICMSRFAYFADIISSKTSYQVCETMVLRAACFFDNWGEYALSSACGAVYYAFCRMVSKEYDQETASNFIKKQLSLLRELTAPEGVWRALYWPKYYPNGKICKIAVRNIKNLYPSRNGPVLCTATDRITVDGAKVGLMWREIPDNAKDSGWRFVAGDESDEYMRDRKNSSIYDLNTICNYDQDIIEFLTLGTGNVLRRFDGGPLRRIDGGLLGW
jgi:hypothetical protein